jgi:chromosome segregation ATPase
MDKDAEIAHLKAALAEAQNALTEAQNALVEAQNALVEAKKECVWLTNLRDSLRAFNTIESERIMMRRCIRHTCSGSAFIFPLSQ